MKPGESLVVFTDGVTDAVRAADHRKEERRGDAIEREVAVGVDLVERSLVQADGASHDGSDEGDDPQQPNEDAVQEPRPDAVTHRGRPRPCRHHDRWIGCRVSRYHPSAHRPTSRLTRLRRLASPAGIEPTTNRLEGQRA